GSRPSRRDMAKEALLPLRRRRAGSRPSRRDMAKEALLPFTGEGARRADEGARAQRSVLLMLPGRATAARFARALIRRCAPPSPAAQEKGWVPTLAARHGEGSPSPVLREKVPEGRMRGASAAKRAFDLSRNPGASSLRSRPHPALRATFSRCAGEGLGPDPRGETWRRKPFSRLREKVPGGRMRGRERSDACL